MSTQKWSEVWLYQSLVYYEELTFEEALLGGENSPLVGWEGAGEGKILPLRKLLTIILKFWHLIMFDMTY